MPTFNGVIVDLGGHQEPPSWSRSPEISEYTATHWPPYAAREMGALLSGAKTDTQPVTEPQLAKSGAISPNFGADWYDRIHVSPSVVNVGNVIAHQERDVYVWNAHFASKTLAAITPSGTLGGIALTNQPAPPLAFGPLQERHYRLVVDIAGDPVIDGAYTFDFGAERPTLTVTGRRIVLWPIRPDWARGVTERLEWATDVLPAYDGTEQRVRLRSHARRALEMDFIAHGHDARIAETLLFGWGGRKYCLPVWMERDVLASPVAAGATSITVTDAALKDYRVGGLAVLWASTTQAEAIEIAAIAGDTLTLKTATSRAYPAGASVCPGMLARIEGDAPVRRATDAIFETRLRFLDEQAIDRAAAEIGPAWQGYAVLDERPDRADDVSETWSRTLAVLDSLSGIVAVEDTSGQPVIRRTYSWLITGRAAIDRWKRWAAARAGRMNALWLPTFADDLTVVDVIGDAHTTIKVRNALIARYVGAHPLRAAIRIETVGGQVFHRRVTGAIEIDEATESIGIDASLGVTLQPAQIRRVMWMGLARLDADAIEIYYETDSIAQAGLFDEKLSPEARELLSFLAYNIRSPRRIAALIQGYFDALTAVGSPAQQDLLGSRTPPTKAELIAAARRTIDAEEAATTRPEGPGGDQEPGAQNRGQPAGEESARAGAQEPAPEASRQAGQPASPEQTVAQPPAPEEREPASNEAPRAPEQPAPAVEQNQEPAPQEATRPDQSLEEEPGVTGWREALAGIAARHPRARRCPRTRRGSRRRSRGCFPKCSSGMGDSGSRRPSRANDLLKAETS